MNPNNDNSIRFEIETGHAPNALSSSYQKEVLLYARVSTEDQAREGFSIPAQLDRLRVHAQVMGWKVAGEYVDEGYTGRNTKRPRYTAMMASAKPGQTILMTRIDRSHRNLKNFLAMLEDLKARKVHFLSLTENIDTSSAMGEFFLLVVQLIAQLQSDTIRDLVKMGQGEVMRTTSRSFSNGGFGYRLDPNTGILVPHEPEATAARWIVKTYLAGVETGAIAEALNRKNIHTRRDQLWKQEDVWKFLTRCSRIAGLRLSTQHPKAYTHEPLISEVEYAQLQEELNKRGRNQRPDIKETRRQKAHAVLRARATVNPAG
ncbi:MAG: recombinase family protein [Candidatus Thermoplasmatota archaeon]